MATDPTFAARRGRVIMPGDTSQASRAVMPPPGVVTPRTQAMGPGPSMAPSPSSAGKRRDFFAYPITFLSLAAGTAQQGAIQIQADSDFEWTKFTFFADIALADETEATRVLPLVTVQITDTGTGRAVFSTPVPIPAIAGDGRLPFILPTPKIFSANASVAFLVSNFSGGTDYNLRLLLIGAKIFQYG